MSFSTLTTSETAGSAANASRLARSSASESAVASAAKPERRDFMISCSQITDSAPLACRARRL